MKKNVRFEQSSGNVFADLGIENPEEALVRAELARQITNIIKRRKLTQKQAAEILGVDQPQVSAIFHGRLRSFPAERLIRFINGLGHDVIIMISPAKAEEGRGHTWIGESFSTTRIAG